MRRLGWLLAILAALVWLATEVRLPPSPTGAEHSPMGQKPLDCWRRTCDGWQPATWLATPAAPHRPALHPAVVGLLELLLATTALVALPARCGPTHEPSPWQGRSPRQAVHVPHAHRLGRAAAGIGSR